ncbi:extracellular solute-binding protein [Paenibacillaceae bacterium WGS1546]|uniref:ABC transporter substrate-binding protein n=1 Tax=Cohnella sp. WGS1546 TaxID=3366810 RepID=UPI00372D74CE
MTNNGWRLWTVFTVLALIMGGCLHHDGGAPAGSGQQEKITLKLMQFKAEITDQVLAMAEDYMAQHPNIVIEAQVLKDYDTTLITKFASGDAPDIFSIKAYTGIQDWSERLADLSEEPWMGQVTPFAVQGMTVDGRKLGFPMSFEGYGFIYNKDLFAQAGIEQVPKTLTELKQVNEKLKAAGILSYSEGYKEWWILGQHLFNLPFAYEEDPIAVINQINQGEATIADLTYISGFFDVLDMTLEYGQGADTIGVSYDDQVSSFASGKTAMMQQGVWTIESIRSINPDIRIGMFAIPLSDDPAETRLPIGVPGYYVINKKSKHLEASKAFLDWLHRNGQRYLVDSFNSIPAFADLKTSDGLGPLAADLSEYVAGNWTIPWAHTLWPSGSNQEFAKPLLSYVGGGSNREQTIAKLQEIWDSQQRAYTMNLTADGR